VIIGAFKSVGELLGGIGAALVALVSGRFREAFNIGKSMSLDFVGNIQGTVDGVKKIWEGVDIDPGPASDAIAAPVSFAADKVAKAGGRIKSEVDRIEQTVERLRQSVATFGMDDTQKQIFDLQMAGATPDQIERARGYLDELERLNAAKREDARLTKETEDAQREIARVYDATRTPAERLAIEIDRINKLFDFGKNKKNADLYARAMFDAQDRFEAATEAAKKATDEMDDFAKNAAENIQRSLGDNFVDAMNGNFKSVGDGFMQMLQRMVAEALAADLARAMFGGDEKGGVTGKGGWLGGALGAIGDWFGFGGAKAGGGDVLANRSYLVGEQGPERFVPRTAGTIIPAAQTAAAGAGRMAGGLSVTQNFINPQMSDQRTESQRQREAARKLRRSVARLG